MTILSDVKALGQQIWLDNLSRSLVQSGELAEMLKQGVCGVTSNPAIFQKAFAGDALYADEVAALKQQDLTPKQRYETMAVADVQAACDVCLAEHESSGGKTGFVSLEVSPELSKDAQGTVEEARRLHAAIGRKNVMIKVPATDERHRSTRNPRFRRHQRQPDPAFLPCPNPQSLCGLRARHCQTFESRTRRFPYPSCRQLLYFPCRCRIGCHPA